MLGPGSPGRHIVVVEPIRAIVRRTLTVRRIESDVGRPAAVVDAMSRRQQNIGSYQRRRSRESASALGEEQFPAGPVRIVQRRRDCLPSSRAGLYVRFRILLLTVPMWCVSGL